MPRMARELRKAARDSGEDVAAHHGLVKMIPQWERGGRAPRERYRLLCLKIFTDALGGLPHGMDAVDLVLRLAEVRSRAVSGTTIAEVMPSWRMSWRCAGLWAASMSSASGISG